MKLSLGGRRIEAMMEAIPELRHVQDQLRFGKAGIGKRLTRRGAGYGHQRRGAPGGEGFRRCSIFRASDGAEAYVEALPGMAHRPGDAG